jgi:hypothetical protein
LRRCHLRNGAAKTFASPPPGFAGISFGYANAKIKLGYRADFFLGG